MFQCTPDHCGRTASEGPANNSRRWSTNARQGTSGSSPVVAGGRLYAVNSAGETLDVLDAITGGLEWSVGIEGPAEMSPAVGFGHVFVGNARGTLLAIDLGTQEVAWRVPGAEGVLPSPTLAPHELIHAHGSSVFAREPRSGSPIWEFETGDYYGTSDLGYLFRDPNSGGWIHSSPALGPDPVGEGILVVFGCDDGKVYAVEDRPDREGGGGADNLRWTYRASDQPLLGAPAVGESMVYIGTQEGELFALRLEGQEDGFDNDGNGVVDDEGSVEWIYDAGESITSTPAVGAEQIIITTVGGAIHCVDLGGQAIWTDSAPSDGQFDANSPIIAGNRVYVGSSAHFLCFDLDGGDAGRSHVVWSLNSGDAYANSATYAAGTVYAMTDEGKIHAFGATVQPDPDPIPDPDPLPVPPCEPPDDSDDETPTETDDVVYAGTDAGKVHRIAFSSGDIQWTASIDGRVECVAASRNGRWVAVSTHSHVGLLRADDGTLVWSVSNGVAPRRLVELSQIAIDGEGEHVVAAHPDGLCVYRRDRDTDEVVEIWSSAYEARSVAITWNGAHVFAGGDAGVAYYRTLSGDWSDGALGWVSGFGASTLTVDIAVAYDGAPEDGDLYMVAGSRGGQACLYQSASSEPVWAFVASGEADNPGGLMSVAINPAGDRVAVGNDDPTNSTGAVLRLFTPDSGAPATWDAEDGEPAWTWDPGPDGGDDCRAVEFGSSSGSQLVSGGSGGHDGFGIFRHGDDCEKPAWDGRPRGERDDVAFVERDPASHSWLATCDTRRAKVRLYRTHSDSTEPVHHVDTEGRCRSVSAPADDGSETGPGLSLRCEVQVDGAIRLFWDSLGACAQIRVLLDGEEIDAVDGDATSYDFNDPVVPASAAALTFCIEGIAEVGGARVSGRACCSVRLDDVPPVRDLEWEFAADGSVVLTWENAAEYDGIAVYVDGEIAVDGDLDGGARSFILPGELEAAATFCVEATIGAVSASACCEVGEPPIVGLHCAMDANGNVALEWTNDRDDYDSITVFVDRSVHSVLGGAATSCQFQADPNALLCIEVVARIGVRVSAAAMCTAGIVPPVAALTCRALGAIDAELTWTNGSEEYDAIIVEVHVDGTLRGGAVLAGQAVSWTFEGEVEAGAEFSVHALMRPVCDAIGSGSAEVIASARVTCTLEVEVDGPLFRRGDPNGDGDVDLSDPVFILNYLFTGGDRPDCLEAANANGSSGIDIGDAIFLLGYQFGGGPPPPAPGPHECGVDPDDADVDCESYGGC